MKRSFGLAALLVAASAAAGPVRDWLQSSGFEDALLRRLGEESALVIRR